MSMSNLPLMKAISAKVDYLYKRNEVISQNIANADTPGYQSKDLTKVDFGTVLKSMKGAGSISVETTNPMHLPGPDAIRGAKDAKDRLTYEVAPAGNGVILEEQMVKASQTQMEYNLMTNLSRKQSMMMKIALGRQG
jgi:flagellar basal-body rod protein FlgB